VEEELEEWEIIPPEEIPTSIVIIVVIGLIMLHFVTHQMLATGFFTAAFGLVEMIMLYGSLSVWIITSAFILVGRKALSRDFDAYGGLFFAGIGIAWVFVFFPFDFAFFANVLPEFLRFLLLWITNEVARFFMLISIVLNLAMAVYSLTLRVSVRKARRNL
jgi:hypothetical protein